MVSVAIILLSSFGDRTRLFVCETPQNTTLRMETKRVTPRLVLYALNPVLHLFCMDLKNKLRPTAIFDRKEYGPFPKNIH